MLVKIHKNKEGQSIAAICDKYLIGKVITEKDRQLDLNSNFFKGEEKTVDMISDIMRNADIIHVVGEKSVGVALKEELLDEQEVKSIQGVPHAEIIIIDEGL
tara:strand:+ start:109 stop:414 length:306 start_codon:yes stop_codon:yes gene_type:complete